MLADHGVDPASAPPDDTRALRAEAGPFAQLWRRFAAVRKSSRWSAIDDTSADVLTNLLELAVLGDAEDYVRLDRLVRRYGHEQVARIQDRLDPLLGLGPELPLATQALRRLRERRPIADLLVAEGIDHEEADDIALRCSTHAFWMLLTGIDDASRTRTVRTPAELIDLIENGDTPQWRAVLAPIAQHPWGPDAERLLRLAKEANLDTAEEWLSACRLVYRERQEERERAAVAREIRRLVAISGLSQRDFAAHIGTSASRLSTYVTGRVTPSATMMMRIQRAARRLQQRRDEN